jgi:hypothetical protein
MSKYVMVDTISQFRMRYVVEVPDDVENCTPEQYASDSVVCEDVREFSQEHLGETIVSTREVTLEEAIAQWRKDNGGAFDVWSDELVVKNSITEIGFNSKEYYETEEEKWVKKEEERLAEAVRRINEDNDYNEPDGNFGQGSL